MLNKENEEAEEAEEAIYEVLGSDYDNWSSFVNNLNENTVDQYYVQIKEFLNQLASIKGEELSFQQRRRVQYELCDIYQTIGPARSSERRFEFINSSHWSDLLDRLNSAAGSSSLKTDSHLIMDIFNVVAKLAVLGFNSFSGQPLQYRMLALLGPILFDVATYGHARLSTDSPNKELLAYAKLVERIIYRYIQTQLLQSVQRGQSLAASLQDNDAASGAPQSGQSVQSPQLLGKLMLPLPMHHI